MCPSWIHTHQSQQYNLDLSGGGCNDQNRDISMMKTSKLPSPKTLTSPMICHKNPMLHHLGRPVEGNAIEAAWKGRGRLKGRGTQCLNQG